METVPGMFRSFLGKPSKNCQSGSPLYKDIWANDLLKSLLGRNIVVSGFLFPKSAFLVPFRNLQITPVPIYLRFGPWIYDRWATQIIITAPDLSQGAFYAGIPVFWFHILLTRRCPNKTYSEIFVWLTTTTTSRISMNFQDMAKTHRKSTRFSGQDQHLRDVKHIRSTSCEWKDTRKCLGPQGAVDSYDVLKHFTPMTHIGYDKVGLRNTIHHTRLSGRRPEHHGSERLRAAASVDTVFVWVILAWRRSIWCFCYLCLALGP